MDHGGKALVGFFIACGDAAELLKITGEVFYEMTPFVHFKVARNRAGPLSFRRDRGTSAPLIQRGAQPFIGDGLVAEKCGECDVLDQRRNSDAGVPLTGQKRSRAPLRGTAGCRPPGRPGLRLCLEAAVQSGPIASLSTCCESRLTSIFQP